MVAIGSEKDKQALTLRLKRIEGQLRGIQKMIDDNTDCERVAQQLSAARKGLDRAFYEMVACMLEHDLSSEIGKKPQVRARIGTMTGLLAKFA
jgi:DNA-binding FrmR family transcriptional regulator